jgi:hypothetical protein
MAGRDRRSRRLAPVDPVRTRRALGQLPDVQQRSRRRRARQGDRGIHRLGQCLFGRPEPPHDRCGCRHDLPLRRAGGLPDRHDDRGRVRRPAGGPVRGAHAVALRGEIFLRRRAPAGDCGLRYRLSAVVAPCIASRRWRRRRVRRLRRGDQSGGGKRDRIRPPGRHRMRPVLHHLCEHASLAKCTISGCRLAPGSAPCLRARDAGLVPELHRPHPGRLAGGLLRIEPAPSAPGEAGTRP